VQTFSSGFDLHIIDYALTLIHTIRPILKLIVFM